MPERDPTKDPKAGDHFRLESVDAFITRRETDAVYGYMGELLFGWRLEDFQEWAKTSEVLHAAD